MTDTDEDLRKEVQQLRNELEQLKKERKEQYADSDLSNNHPSTTAEKTATAGESSPVDRRTFLKTLAGGAAGASLMGLASGFQIRSPNDFSYFGGGSKEFNVDTSGNITASGINLGGGQITTFTGNNLSVDSNGNLNADNTDTNTHVDVENTDGSPLVQNVNAIQAGTDLDFTDDGDGTATLDYVGSGGSSSSSSPVYIDPNTSFEHIKLGPDEEFNENHS